MWSRLRISLRLISISILSRIGTVFHSFDGDYLIWLLSKMAEGARLKAEGKKIY
jgi:hypothetical protein